MVWAKVINNEIMQMHDEDPAGLWHPNLLEFWQEVPDEVNIGWKFKNGKWIPGGQWQEEFEKENPPPPPGPPAANWGFTIKELGPDKVTIEFHGNPAGIFESISWKIDGKDYTDEIVTVNFDLDQARDVPVIFKVVGPGGEAINSLGIDHIALKAKIIPV